MTDTKRTDKTYATNRKTGVTDRSYTTDRTDRSHQTPPKKYHGGYRNLRSYQTTTIIYDLTVEFCRLYVSKFSRTTDQMIQAARSGRQNIAEGSQASGTSKKTEIKLVGVARASLEELLIDYEDFLRQRGLKLWEKENSSARAIRAIAYRSDKTYETYKTYLMDSESAANMLICLIHQANFLLDRQLSSLEQSFVTEGGYSEQLFRKRAAQRSDRTYTTHRTNKTYGGKDR
ncbi:MAG TPA: four helix bundle suffix domain-containing protein [Xanthomonadales bacterium]|nr:four helix bundle suffix domain-containing protein [Xanthomonadales bacterium]